MNIVDGFQKKHIKLIERFITAAGWIFILIYFIQVSLSVVIWAFNLSNFYHKLFILPDIITTVVTLIITIVIAILAFLIIYVWGRYNYKKYAHLNRRSFPKVVTVDETAEYFNLPSEIVIKMQNSRRIQLQKTIV